jgi:hypothetical protein
VIRSLLSTAKKQGWNMLDTLAADPNGSSPNSRARDKLTWVVTIRL